MLNWQEFVILTIEYGATVQEETAVKVKLREQIQQMVSSMERRWNGTNYFKRFKDLTEEQIHAILVSRGGGSMKI